MKIRHEPWFKRLFTNPIDKFSDWLKRNTTQNIQDWLLAVLFTGGVIPTILYENNDYILKDRVQNIVLWMTFVAILWYTKETFWLKEVQQKTLRQQRIRDDGDVLPFLDCRLSYSQDHFLSIKNTGKGLAKEVNFFVIFDGHNHLKRVTSILPQEEFVPDDLDDNEFLRLFGSKNFKSPDNLETIVVKGDYSDIFSRKYSFEYIFTHKDSIFLLSSVSQCPDGWKIGDGM